MDLNFSAFQEPRGVMRILHFVFSICAFATITGFSGFVAIKCPNDNEFTYDYSYPYNFQLNLTEKAKCQVTVEGDFSSDAQFFVATGVLAMLYSIAIMAIYVKFDETYKSNNQWPLYDFIMTVIFGVLWLSSSAAWANSLLGLKNIVDSPFYNCKGCVATPGSYSSLNISVVFGFLNFFLWAADLWFLYKETAWFQGNPHQTDGGN
ncbi:unnamed protein product [Brassicogethes aeneus]|uniref:MARVEL domain-containing protein n=1 Tax=Brassicogethes aeneus TaxID=1431903 RepID=A0A9P0BHH4_BRAAE|nr:unnamed protein product [Brassicogethes aeneus]